MTKMYFHKEVSTGELWEAQNNCVVGTPLIEIGDLLLWSYESQMWYKINFNTYTFGMISDERVQKILNEVRKISL